MGGEHNAHQSHVGSNGGSSPRGRGTQRQVCSVRGCHRFIPAWAGNTAPCTPARILSAVHPRVGGEHLSCFGTSSDPFGSSPRGRGTRPGAAACWRARRFIPAWAGNTARRRSTRSARTVHPRVGGEHSRHASIACASAGSSPRGRGTRGRNAATAGQVRFIPAWAGNTPRRKRIRPQTAVHPRVGGEHSFFLNSSWLNLGSSPRGRGTLCFQFPKNLK